ncbi:MAG TPA: PAS domain-containing protein [Rhizomicrobium sp.]|nr:PAS domain-containing protein [Rhizomicrobium sp.]
MIAGMDIRAAIDAFNACSAAEGWEQVCDPALAFTHPDYHALVALWRALAGGRALPVRADMTARVLKDYLPNIAIKERIAREPSRYRWRLMGTRVAQVIGERTGKLAEEDASPRLIARANANCDLTLLAGEPLRFLGRVLARGKDYLASEALYLPLAGDDGAARFVLAFGYYSAGQSWRRNAAAAAG